MTISGDDVRALACPQCGAHVEMPVGRISDRCAFCDNALVETEATNVAIDLVAPFQLDQAQAANRLASELAGRWAAPEEVRKKGRPEELKGLYVPFWAYDASARSDYSAKVGIHWYRTETYTEEVNGQTVTRTRQVKETEWFRVNGSHAADYQDQLVSASNGLPEDESNELEPFDLGLAHPYSPTLLAGWIAESPSIDRDTAKHTAHQEFADLENDAIRSFLPGDVNKKVKNETQIDISGVRLLMLPIWVANYHHGGEVFRLLVNGQTGEVVGDTPVSRAKGVLLVMIIIVVLAGMLYGMGAFG